MGQFKMLVMPLLVVVCSTVALGADDAAIQDFLRAYVDAFNKQDLDAVSAMWAENGSYVDRETGDRTEGRAAIRADLAEVFKKAAKAHLEGTVDRVRWLKPDLARVEGKTTTSVPDEEPSVSQFSAVLVKQGEKWLFEAVEEMPVPQPSSANDALRELQWLEGDWVDDSKDSPVVSTFQWSAGRAFLIRSFSTKEGEQTVRLGTQIIGWDPRSGQIRSWTFNADGSFGDGVWSKTGDAWSIKATQTLSDGRAASGTYIVSRVDDNTLTLRLIGQEIEGESVPASDPVSLRRVSDASGPATQNESKPSK
ncbi:MAG: SgcJ/EcaC family oxidoreductase [Pirellulales bacterium]|nr:SgcJ/EcaC family oxidoreductase [Pirellulales bacterium]